MSDAAPDFMAALGALAARWVSPDLAGDFGGLVTLIRKMPYPGQIGDAQRLSAVYQILGRYMTYTPPRGLARPSVHDAEQWVRTSIAARIESTFHYLPEDFDFPLARDDLERLLGPYLTWLGSEAEDYHVDEILHGAAITGNVVGSVLKTVGKHLEVVGRRDEGWTDGIDEAFGLHYRFDPQWLWGWAERGPELTRLLEHRHEMVRANAARFFGIKIADAIEAPDAEENKGVPSLADAFELIARQEASLGNVACGFIDGLGSFEENRRPFGPGPDVKGRMEKLGFDFRAWALEICRTDPEARRSAPNAFPWSTHVREFFRADPDAVRQLIAMGQGRLAFMTASVEPSEAMMPMIVRLAIGDDPELARDARNFLRQLQNG